MDTEKITSPAPEGQAESLHPLLQEEITGLENRIARIRKMGPQVVIAEDCAKRFPVTYSAKSVDWIGWDINIHFVFQTVAQAAEVLRYLATEKGLHRKGRVVKSDDGATFFWNFPGICLIGHFSSNEASACKLVQVGTKTVPVYELRCGDKPAEAELEPVAPPVSAPVAAELEGMPF